MSEIEMVVSILLMAVVGFAGGFITGIITEGTSAQKDAIENGVGEYYLDENHNKQFRWKKP